MPLAAKPPLLDWPAIRLRLEALFPEGTTNRGYVTREMAAKTVFVLLYIEAIEGTERWLRPDQVARMSDAQAARTGLEERRRWTVESLASTRESPPGAWYAKNTREPIRDETLRQGLISAGAVLERPGIATTSPLPRYALREDFAALFDPRLEGQAFAAAAEAWRAKRLSLGALARVEILRRSAVETGQGVLARFPNGETRRLTEGASAQIAKAVIEEFAPRFLERPGVLWLSESAKKTDRRDEDLAARLGLEIDPEKALPDLILVDVGGEQLFVFVEAVASDGPMHEERRSVFLKRVEAAGYTGDHAAFLTAYLDRDSPGFRRTFSALAHRSFAWCLSEPELLIGLHRRDEGRTLRDLVAKPKD